MRLSVSKKVSALGPLSAKTKKTDDKVSCKYVQVI